MKLAEVSTLLDVIAGMDGRSFPPNAPDSWHAVLRHYPLADAMRAVEEHYALNEQRVMPTHVRTRCLQLRDLRAAEERRSIAPPPPPKLTKVGIEARAEVYRLLGVVSRKSDAAMRPAPRADASEPTSADSPIDEVERQRQLRRLRHEGPQGGTR